MKDRWDEVVGPLLEAGVLRRITMMGYPCVQRQDGKLAAGFDARADRPMFKLTPDRAAELIESGVAGPFSPNGRTAKAWVTAGPDDPELWADLLDEALHV